MTQQSNEASNRSVSPGRHASLKNQRAAAKVYVKASRKAGRPVPAVVQRLAAQAP